MTKRRSNSVFLVVNVVISLAVALLVIAVYTSLQPVEPDRARPTIVLVVTATPDAGALLPAAALQGTVDAQAGTIVALQREAAAPIAQGDNLIPSRPPDGASQSSNENLPTIDPALIPNLPEAPVTGANNTSVDLPEDGCERYFVQSGDTAGAIASRFEVQLSALFVLNGITDQTILQVGDELLIPGDTCEPEVPPTASPVPRPTFNLTLVAPTATLPQITQDSQVQIVNISNSGDVTAEEVEIRNQGGQINLLGWTLSDSEGNIYTFPDVRLVQNSIIRIATRTGQNTPGFLYWNQNSPVWASGETATLSDAAGNPQSIFTVGGEVIDFGTSTP